MNTDDLTALASAIKQYRVASGGMTQAEFGEIVGKDQQSVANWEGGAIPLDDVLEKICDLVGVDFDEAKSIRAARRMAKKASSKVVGNKNITTTMSAGGDITQTDEKINYPSMHHQYAVELILKSDEETAKKVIAMLIKV